MLEVFRALIEAAPDEVALSEAKARIFPVLWGVAAQVEADVSPHAALKSPLDTEAILLSEQTPETDMRHRLVSLAEDLSR